MELYLPRRTIRDMTRKVKAEALPDDVTILNRFDTLPFMDQDYFGAFHQFKLTTLYEYLNNFHCYFPETDDLSLSYYRQLHTNNGSLNITNRESAIAQISQTRRPLHLKPETMYSPMALSQTNGQFLETIESVTAFNNVPLGMVADLYSHHRMSVPHMIKAGRLIFPVYVHLRALGYGHGELTR